MRTYTNDDIRSAYDRAHAEYRAGKPHTGRMLWKVARRMEEKLNEQHSQEKE